MIDVFVIDPPWGYRAKQSIAKTSCINATSETYRSATIDHLKRMREPLQKLATPRSIIYMHTPGATLAEAIELLAAWGWRFGQVAFVWDKCRPNPGSYTLTQCEFVIAGIRGGIPNGHRGGSYRGVSHKQRQLVTQPRTRHSEKPEQIQDRIELMHPGTAKLEVFARRHRPGWLCIGNELDGLDILDSLAVVSAQNPVSPSSSGIAAPE